MEAEVIPIINNPQFTNFHQVEIGIRTKPRTTTKAKSKNRFIDHKEYLFNHSNTTSGMSFV